MRATIAVAACVLLAVTSSSCADATDTTSASCSQTTANPATVAPKFAAVVSKVIFQSGPTPAGYSISQYDLWVIGPPSTTANAGVLVGEATPVFIRTSNGALTPAGGCAIAMGDALDVWHDGTLVVGSAQAPPGDTAFFATQVVIHR